MRQQGALLHGSELRTDPPSPELGSGHSATVGHPKTGHRIEDLARQLYFNALPSEGSTSHTSSDDRLVPVDSILDHTALAVPGPFVPLAPTKLADGVDVPVSLLQRGRRSWSQLGISSRWDKHPHGSSLSHASLRPNVLRPQVPPHSLRAPPYTWCASGDKTPWQTC